MLLYSDNVVDKSEFSNDTDSIWTDEDEDLSNSDSTDGKNMLPLCITVQCLTNKRTMNKLPEEGCFQSLTSLARP